MRREKSLRSCAKGMISLKVRVGDYKPPRFYLTVHDITYVYSEFEDAITDYRMHRKAHRRTKKEKPMNESQKLQELTELYDELKEMTEKLERIKEAEKQLEEIHNHIKHTQSLLNRTWMLFRP